MLQNDDTTKPLIAIGNVTEHHGENVQHHNFYQSQWSILSL